MHSYPEDGETGSSKMLVTTYKTTQNFPEDHDPNI
jgi:hypothetical protein